MKKIFFTLLCLCIFNTNAIAASVTSCEMDENGNCPAGCEPNSTGTACLLCKNGFYKSGTNTNKCTKCVFPAGVTYKQDDEDGLTSPCEWTATCAADQYWIPANEGFGCALCSGGYTAKDGSAEFNVSGSGLRPNVGVTTDLIMWLTNHSAKNRCEGKIYDLILKPNSIPGAFVEGEWVEWKEQHAFVKYQTGFSTDINGGWDDQGLPKSVIPANRPYQKFLGYYDNKTGSDTTPYFTSDGWFNESYLNLIKLAQPDTNNDGRDDITLYARWDFKSFEIVYKSDDTADAQILNQTCSYNNDKFQCKVSDFPSNWLPPIGKVFQEYKCYYLSDGKQQECPGTSVYHPGDDILPPDTDEEMTRYFVAQYKECRAGYYCVDGDETPCPLGTTSAGGAASKENCYMVRGNNGTRFCDSNGWCFFLPGRGNIYFDPGTP